MKKNKYDIFLTLKKLKKNKLLNNLSTLNDEKKRLDFVKETLNEMLSQSAVEESGELSGSDLKFRASFTSNLINKLEVSKNRENHVLDEISHNLKEIVKIEKQKEKISEKKKFIKIQEDKIKELKKENYFKPKNSVSL